jgi:hypothetical protein
MSGNGLVGDFSPSSLSAGHVSLRIRCWRTPAELTEVGEALELVQTALHKAWRKTCCRWSHRETAAEVLRCVDVWEYVGRGGRINCAWTELR